MINFQLRSRWKLITFKLPNTGIIEYQEFIGILRNWRTEILNSFKRPYEDHKLSNAFCENINGKIRTYIEISRGIANFARFRKRVLFALNPKILAMTL